MRVKPTASAIYLKIQHFSSIIKYAICVNTPFFYFIFIFNLAGREGTAATEKGGDRAYLESDTVYIPQSVLHHYLPYRGSSGDNAGFAMWLWKSPACV